MTGRRKQGPDPVEAKKRFVVEASVQQVQQTGRRRAKAKEAEAAVKLSEAYCCFKRSSRWYRRTARSTRHGAPTDA